MLPKQISTKHHFTPEIWPEIRLNPIDFKNVRVICTYDKRDIVATWTDEIESLVIELAKMGLTAKHFVKKEGHCEINLVVEDDKEKGMTTLAYSIQKRHEHHFLTSTKPTNFELEIMHHELNKQAKYMYWAMSGEWPSFEREGTPRLQIEKGSIKCKKVVDNGVIIYSVTDVYCKFNDHW